MVPCPAGTTSSWGATALTACTLCAPGTYSSDSLISYCATPSQMPPNVYYNDADHSFNYCPAGTEAQVPGAGLGSCTPCGVGFYSQEGGYCHDVSGCYNSFYCVGWVESNDPRYLEGTPGQMLRCPAGYQCPGGGAGSNTGVAGPPSLCPSGT